MTFPIQFVEAMKLAFEAGKFIMKVYESTRLEIQIKSDNSPLTRADLLSHNHLYYGLMKTGIPVISEEGDNKLWGKRLSWPKYWLIDPLDGTKEFISRNGEFTVNIALMVNGNPVWGLIYAPVPNILYGGIVGNGTWVWDMNHIDFSRQDFNLLPGEVLPNVTFKENLIIVGSKSHLSETSCSFVERIKKTQGEITFVRAGSSLKFCRIASGEAHIYPRMDSIMEWDIAAGQAIVIASGGKMVTWPNMGLPDYSSTNMRSSSFIASSAGIDISEILKVK